MNNTNQYLFTLMSRLRMSGLAVLAAMLIPALTHGQLPAGRDGLANRAVGRLGELSQNGPGYLYYGVNAADRGLGYIGSYMTLGGFIPFAEDGLGGVWNADLRSHLSVYGGFFSNVGAVRKQLLGGGSLLGFGVYWDYDGDLNQYPTFGQPDALFGQFGHVYQQVGVSGELLTDWGNLRSNGYIPVGKTGYQLVTNPSNGLFYQNFIIPQNGLDAALGGADLEVGAYVPGLADWAGMINVGGYAFGNARYTKIGGPNDGGDLVPWFGGVYTRLDLTFADKWDFSLQYNNDSFFDSTGFARLTYRMGGSRRRNVPDQMEQPMFRNEHIVRAHETPLAALNPENGNQPWQVVHVDNTAFPGGDGTVERPFQTLAEAQGSPIVANQEWAITYLHLGNASTTLNAYTNPFTFQQPNQFLVGSGGPLSIATQPIGGSSIFTVPATTSLNPILSNPDPAGTSVAINGTGGVTVANLHMIGSRFGIQATGNLTGTPQPAGTTANPGGLQLAANGAASIRNVRISGDGTNAPQNGIELTNATGDLEATDTIIENMTRQGLQVDSGSANVDYFGRITSNVAENGNVSVGNILVNIIDTTGGVLNIGSRTAPLSTSTPNRLLDVGGEGIFIARNSAATEINIGSATLVNNVVSAIRVGDDNSSISITTIADPPAGYDFGIVKNTPGAVIAIDGGGPEFNFFGTINNAPPSIASRDIIQMVNLDGTQRPVDSRTISISGPGLTPLQDGGNGVFISGVNNYESVEITGLSLSGTSTNGIALENSDDSQFAFNNTTISGSIGEAVLLDNLGGGSSVTFTSLDVALNNSGTVGIAYQNSNNTGLVKFTDTSITGATAQGVLLRNNVNTTTAFDGLSVNLTGGLAQALNATDGGRVYTTGDNTIANASTTLAAIYVAGTTTLSGPAGEHLDFLSVTSGNTQQIGQIVGLSVVTPGNGYAASTTVPVDANSPSTVGGTTATADATTDAAGTVTAVAVTTAGGGYATGDIVSLPPSDPNVAVTTQATARVDATANPTEAAITIVGGGVSGEINMNTFTVGGSDGTGVNVINNGNVTVRAGGTKISGP